MRVVLIIGFASVLACLASSASALEVPVSVTKVTEGGQTLPLDGVEVALEDWRSVPGPKAQRDLDAVYHARTDSQGVARFDVPLAASGAQRVASLVYQGNTYVSDAIEVASAGAALRVYDTSASLEALQGRMTISLDVRDGFVIVDTTLVVFNTQRVTIDTRRAGSGLRVPVALPAVGETPWESGVIPSSTGPRHVSLRQSPERGRYQFHEGSIYYQGPLFPGQPTTLQVRYALPIIDERQDVALTSPMDLEQLLITTTWTDRVAPRVVPDRAFLAVGREPGESVQRFMRIEAPPVAGEAIVIRVDRLPRPHKVQNQLAVGGGVSLLVLFGLSLVALRRRHE